MSYLEKDLAPVKKTLSGQTKKLTARTMRMICEELGVTHWKDVQAALLKGINSAPPYSLQYLRLFADFIDGRPWQETADQGTHITIQIGGSAPLTIQAHHPPTSSAHAIDGGIDMPTLDPIDVLALTAGSTPPDPTLELETPPKTAALMPSIGLTIKGTGEYPTG